jgi:hypothetical protein
MTGIQVYISEKEKKLILKALNQLTLSEKEQKIKENIVRKLTRYD